MSSLVCGLDVHKDSIYATVMNYGGEIIDERKLANDEVTNYLGRYPIDKVAMESSTSIVTLYRALRGKGYEILVSHPKKTRLIAESRIKTDRVDSWAVTELARLDALPLSYMPPDDIAALRVTFSRMFFQDLVANSAWTLRAAPGGKPRPALCLLTEVVGLTICPVSRRITPSYRRPSRSTGRLCACWRCIGKLSSG